MADNVQQIKDKLSIVDVVSGYVKLTRMGSALKARCPFHAERTPSFNVSEERGTYHCFGCGVGGDIFSFIQAIEGVDFKGALKMLAERAGVKLEFTPGAEKEDNEKDKLYTLVEAATIFYQSKLNDDAKKYLHERGVTDATIKEFRIGWAGNGWTELYDHLVQKKYSEKEILAAGLGAPGDRGTRDKFRNRIMFPIADTAGRVVAFSGRTFGPDAHPEAPKYLNSPETALFHKSSILYGFDRAKQPMRQIGCAILVEGQMDLIMSHQAGWGNTVAASGTAFTADHALLIKRMTENLVLALDADEAGIKAAGKSARIALASGLRVKVVQIESGKDPADLIHHEGVEVWKKAIKDAKDIITFLLDVLEKHTGGGQKFYRLAEIVVIPFIADVKSPVDQDVYVRKVSSRIGSSEKSIFEALERVPRAQEFSKPEVVEATVHTKIPDRARLAYGLLLWQKTVPKPAFDTDDFAQRLESAIGSSALQVLELLSEGERESLRFEAERVHAKTALKREVDVIVSQLEKDRLERELKILTESLRRVEARGAEGEEQELQQKIRLLTSRIAQIHTKV